MPDMKNQKDYDRLRAQLKINPLLLDEQLSDLPMLCMEAGEFMAEVGADVDYAQKKLNDLVTETQLTTREKKAAAGEKVTEKLIEAEVESDPVVMKARSGLLQLNYEKDLWNNLFRAFQTKTSAIKYYCEMVKAGYITPNTAYKDVRAGVQELSKPKREAI